jgi:hypothetical protein
MSSQSLPRPAAKARAPKSQTTRRTTAAPTSPTDAAARQANILDLLQLELLDVRAICGVCAAALDPGDDSVRLLAMAEARVQDVRQGLLSLAQEIAAGVSHE